MIIFAIMDIGYFGDMVNYIANKWQVGYISPTELQNSFNLAQKQYQHELIETVIGWDANRKKVKLPMANAKQAKQKLAPFIVRIEAYNPTAPYRVPKPADLVDIIGMRIFDNSKRIWRVEQDRIPSHISSVIDSITDNPIYVEYDTYYQLFPPVGTINWDYVRVAPDVVYGYTIVNNRPVYNAGTSIQPIWGDLEMSDILSRVLFMFGISIQAQNLTQYYSETTKIGQ